MSHVSFTRRHALGCAILAFVAVLLLVATAPGASAQSDEPRVLALGDSITAGGEYRYALGDCDVTWVGPYETTNGATLPGFRELHAGYSGRTARDVNNVLAVGPHNGTPLGRHPVLKLADYEHDIALIHLGTNDFQGGTPASDVFNHIEEIVGKLRLANPSVQIFVAKIVPLREGYTLAGNDNHQDFADGLDQKVDQWNSDAFENSGTSKVFAVDMFSDDIFDASDGDLYRGDPIHPSNAGGVVMAAQWREALQRFAGVSCAGAESVPRIEQPPDAEADPGVVAKEFSVLRTGGEVTWRWTRASSDEQADWNYRIFERQPLWETRDTPAASATGFTDIRTMDDDLTSCAFVQAIAPGGLYQDYSPALCKLGTPQISSSSEHLFEWTRPNLVDHFTVRVEKKGPNDSQWSPVVVVRDQTEPYWNPGTEPDNAEYKIALVAHASMGGDRPSWTRGSGSSAVTVKPTVIDSALARLEVEHAKPKTAEDLNLSAIAYNTGDGGRFRYNWQSLGDGWTYEFARLKGNPNPGVDATGATLKLTDTGVFVDPDPGLMHCGQVRGNHESGIRTDFTEPVCVAPVPKLDPQGAGLFSWIVGGSETVRFDYSVTGPGYRKSETTGGNTPAFRRFEIPDDYVPPADGSTTWVLRVKSNSSFSDDERGRSVSPIKTTVNFGTEEVSRMREVTLYDSPYVTYRKDVVPGPKIDAERHFAPDGSLDRIEFEWTEPAANEQDTVFEVKLKAPFDMQDVSPQWKYSYFVCADPTSEGGATLCNDPHAGEGRVTRGEVGQPNSATWSAKPGGTLAQPSSISYNSLTVRPPDTPDPTTSEEGRVEGKWNFNLDPWAPADSRPYCIQVRAFVDGNASRWTKKCDMAPPKVTATSGASLAFRWSYVDYVAKDDGYEYIAARYELGDGPGVEPPASGDTGVSNWETGTTSRNEAARIFEANTTGNWCIWVRAISAPEEPYGTSEWARQCEEYLLLPAPTVEAVMVMSRATNNDQRVAAIEWFWGAVSQGGDDADGYEVKMWRETIPADDYECKTPPEDVPLDQVDPALIDDCVWIDGKRELAGLSDLGFPQYEGIKAPRDSELAAEGMPELAAEGMPLYIGPDRRSITKTLPVKDGWCVKVRAISATRGGEFSPAICPKVTLPLIGSERVREPTPRQVTDAERVSKQIWVSPGDDVAALARTPGLDGATFLFRAGEVYTGVHNVVPQDGQQFIGVQAEGETQRPIFDGEGQRGKSAFTTMVKGTPTERVVEFESAAANVVIKGIEFRNYAPGAYRGTIHGQNTIAPTKEDGEPGGPYPQGWPADGHGRELSWTISNVAVDNTDGYAFYLASGFHLSNFSATRSTMLGIGGNAMSGVTITNGYVAENGKAYRERSELWHHSGGIKLTRSRNIEITNLDVLNNTGPGIWVDITMVDIRIRDNTVTDNLGPGIFYEISFFGDITRNTVLRNARINTGTWIMNLAGILVSSSRSVTVKDNIVADSPVGVLILDQSDFRTNWNWTGGSYEVLPGPWLLPQASDFGNAANRNMSSQPTRFASIDTQISDNHVCNTQYNGMISRFAAPEVIDAFIASQPDLDPSDAATTDAEGNRAEAAPTAEGRKVRKYLSQVYQGEFTQFSSNKYQNDEFMAPPLFRMNYPGPSPDFEAWNATEEDGQVGHDVTSSESQVTTRCPRPTMSATPPAGAAEEASSLPTQPRPDRPATISCSVSADGSRVSWTPLASTGLSNYWLYYQATEESGQPIWVKKIATGDPDHHDITDRERRDGRSFQVHAARPNGSITKCFNVGGGEPTPAPEPAPVPTPEPAPVPTPEPTPVPPTPSAPSEPPTLDGDDFRCAVEGDRLVWDDHQASKYWVYKSVDGGTIYTWIGRTHGETSFPIPTAHRGADVKYQVHYQGVPRVTCGRLMRPESSPTPLGCDEAVRQTSLNLHVSDEVARLLLDRSRAGCAEALVYFAGNINPDAPTRRIGFQALRRLAEPQYVFDEKFRVEDFRPAYEDYFDAIAQAALTATEIRNEFALSAATQALLLGPGGSMSDQIAENFDLSVVEFSYTDFEFDINAEVRDIKYVADRYGLVRAARSSQFPASIEAIESYTRTFISQEIALEDADYLPGTIDFDASSRFSKWSAGRDSQFVARQPYAAAAVLAISGDVDAAEFVLVEAWPDDDMGVVVEDPALEFAGEIFTVGLGQLPNVGRNLDKVFQAIDMGQLARAGALNDYEELPFYSYIEMADFLFNPPVAQEPDPYQPYDAYSDTFVARVTAKFAGDEAAAMECLETVSEYIEEMPDRFGRYSPYLLFANGDYHICEMCPFDESKIHPFGCGNGGEMRTPLTNERTLWMENLIAKSWENQGKLVTYLSTSENYVPRDLLGRTPAAPSKRPDLLVDGRFRDMFTPATSNNVLANALGKVREGQTQYVDIVLLESTVTIDDVKRQLLEEIAASEGGELGGFENEFSHVSRAADGNMVRYPVREITVTTVSAEAFERFRRGDSTQLPIPEVIYPSPTQ